MGYRSHGCGGPQVDELLELLDAGRQRWIEGKLGFSRGFDVEQDADMSIFGPFGGEALRGTEQLTGRQDRAAELFSGGTGTSEVVRTIVSGDLVVVVLVERNDARVLGGDEPQPWVLRTMQVFERRSEGWVRLHRHADPLIDRRPPPVTFAIARGE